MPEIRTIIMALFLRVSGTLSVFLLLVLPALADISGTITDNSPPPQPGVIGVVGFVSGGLNDLILIEPDIIEFADSTPSHNFVIPCDPNTYYDLAVVGWDSLADGPPRLVTDFRYNVKGDSSGLSLNITPNTNRISGRLVEFDGSDWIEEEAMVWARDTTSKTLVALAFADPTGNYSLDHLPGAGPYDLICTASRHYLREDSGHTNPSVVPDIDLKKCGQTGIISSVNSGFPVTNIDRARWVLSDRQNYTLIFRVYNATTAEGGKPITEVTFQAPGGLGGLFGNPTRYWLSPVTGNHSQNLDWTNISVDTSKLRHRVTFSQGSGTQVILPGDTSAFAIRIDSMLNVPRDSYGNWTVKVQDTSGTPGSADEPASFPDSLGWLSSVQKIMQITDISFSPPSTNNGEEPPNVDRVMAVWARNHGTATFYPYWNWTNAWSNGAFAWLAGKTVASSAPAGELIELLHYDVVRTTGNLGDYEIYASTNDSSSFNWVDYTEPLRITATGVTYEQNSNENPQAFSLLQNEPNPFNARTRIAYRLPVLSEVELAIYDILGHKVATLVKGLQDAGDKTVFWSGKDDADQAVASGIYFYRLQVYSKNGSTFSSTRRMILLK